MNLWIKICGTASLKDALLAADAGADAVGFVFAPSPRRVTANMVATIAPQMPEQVEKVGVFVDATLDEIGTIAHACRLTGVQLHSECNAELPARLKQDFGSDFRVLRVVHFSEDAVRQTIAIDGDPNVDAILIDSRTAGAIGGTGVAFDWNAARASVFQSGQARKPRIAAGGLNPANVSDAIAMLRPWGVDVVSGVEAAPGRKDPDKVRTFIANARAASRNL